MSAVRLPEKQELPPPRIEEVSPGVFAYLQPDGGWGLNNTGFLVGSDGVVVIDSCFTERRTRAFLDVIRRTARPDLPVRTLINTHHHGDHTHGNYLFRPATIVGHERCREEVMAAGRGTFSFFPDVAWGNIEIAAPAVTFLERLDVYVDDLRVELIYMGPAHTTNDIVAWLPERRVLFSGDLVFNGGTPFVMMGSVAGSLTALGRLKELRPEIIVPGHGPVCGPEALEDNASYLRFLEEVARRGYDDGITPLEAARGADLGQFGGLLDRERLAGNLHRAYSELKGEPLGTPLELPSVFQDIVAYNGGQVPRCLA